MLTVCFSVKGGQGCTTVAASLALARGGRATVVDAAGDVPAVLGLREPTGPGLVDLLSSDPLSVDALHAVAVDAGRVGVVPLGHQTTEALASERWRELAEALVDDDGMWVLDAGTGPAWEAAAVPGTRSVLVVRNWYLALRRAVQSPVRPSAVVLIEEPGRALRHPEVEAVLPGQPSSPFRPTRRWPERSTPASCPHGYRRAWAPV